MEDSRVSLIAPLSGPKLAAAPKADLPRDFVPMRLLLQPGGFSVLLDRSEAVVGRHSNADVRLTLSDVSRRHCRFVFSDGAWRVFDMKSLNGVYVNGEKLQEATLFHGDRLQIGSLVFEVELDGGERPQMKKAS